MHTIRAQHDVRIEAPCGRVFAVLADYASYPQLFDAVRVVEVHARDEGVCSVTFVVDVLVHIECKVRLVEDHPTSLRFTRTDANLLQHMSGSWTLTDADAGAACRVAFAVEVKLAGQIPQVVQQRLITHRLPEMLECLRRHVEKQSVA